MGCPPTPLSCLEPTNIFAGVYNPRCGGFGDPSSFQAEQAVYKNIFEEMINNYGIDVNYYSIGFNLSASNELYGEHPTNEYFGPFIVKGYPELEEAFSITRYGYVADDTLTLYIAIDAFTDAATTHMTTLTSTFFYDNGLRIEPKSDDLIEVTALGCNRPGNRGSKIFRVSQVTDQDVSKNINPLMGHYVWMINAVRYETSHETNAPQEIGNDQVYDNNFAGKLSSVLFPSLSTDEKVYPYDVDETSVDDVYDMDVNDTSVYGYYYNQ